MAISFVAAGTVVTGANPSVGFPAGITAGDLLLIVTTGSASPSAVGAGYWTPLYVQGANNFVSVYAKIASPSDSGTVGITQTGVATKAVMLAYRGVGWFDVIATVATGSNTSPKTNSQTTGFTNDYVVSIYSASASGAITWTAPTSTTSRVNSAVTSTIAGLLVVDELQAAAGATTQRTATLSSTDNWTAISISIREPRTCYWVGAAGTWSSTSKTNWATSSGGTAGTIVPGYDDVVFDANSNTGTTAWTVTLSTTSWAMCNNFSTSALDATMTLAFGTSNYGLTCLGNFTAPATNFATTPASPSSTSGNLLFQPLGSQTFTSNGVTFGNININSAGGTLSLGSALTCYAIDLTNGTFTTTASNYAITGTALFTNGGGTSTLTLNGSTLTTTGDFGSTGTYNGLTLSAGTSTINLSGTSPLFGGMNKTYNNVSFTNTTLINAAIRGTTTNTFANLSFALQTSAGVRPVTIYCNQTITGTLTVQSSSTNVANRIFLLSDTQGTARTITSATNSIYNTDFRDITAAGAASWTDSSRTNYWGNMKGNTGITFPTGRTVYYSLSAGGNWSSTAWALASAGTPAAQYYPLPQDTAIIDNSSALAGRTITFSTALTTVGTLDASTRSTSLILTDSTNCDINIVGDWILSSSITVTSNSSSAISLCGRTTQTITTLTEGLPGGNVKVESVGGTVQLGSDYIALAVNTQIFTVTNGTFNTQNYNMTVDNFVVSGTATRAVTLGTSYITIEGQGGNAFDLGTSTSGLTFSGANSTIEFTNTSTSGRQFTGNSQTFGTIIIGGGTSTSTMTLKGTFTANTISSTRTSAYTISGPGTADIMTVSNFNVSGTSALARVTLGAGASSALKMVYAGTTNVSCDYLNIVYSTVSPTTNTWYAGANSLNGGTTTGWIFTAPPTSANFFLLF